MISHTGILMEMGKADGVTRVTNILLWSHGVEKHYTH